MIIELIKIAALCMVMGVASIPISFTINSSPIFVWFGNAIGSLVSALLVVYIIRLLTGKGPANRLSRSRLAKKIDKVLEKGQSNKDVKGATNFINKYGLRIFSLLCPLFPGVLISTVVVYLLNLDRRIYVRWMVTGVIFVSGLYVFGYWWVFVK